MGPTIRAGDSLSHFHNACTNGEQQPVVFPHSRQKAGGDGGVAMLQHHDEFNTAKASFLNVPSSQFQLWAEESSATYRRRSNANQSKKCCLAACCDPRGFICVSSTSCCF